MGDLPAVISLVKSAYAPRGPCAGPLLSADTPRRASRSGPAVVLPLRFCVAFPLVFHTLSGYRHLVWDFTQKGIDNSSADKSSKALFGGSFALSALLAAM